MPAAVSMEQLEIRLTDCLSTLEAKLRSCANAGYTDENKRSEVIARDILNILLGTSYELEPRVNSPGFDLRDSDEMSLVQITSKHTIGKVTDCLRTTTERVAKETDLCGYELKILFLTTDSKTTEKLKSDTTKKLPKLGLDLSCIEFDPETNLLDFNDLLRLLRENHVTREQMAQLSDLMDKYWPHIAGQPAVTDRVQEIIKQYADNFTAPLFMHRDSETVTLQNMYVEPSFDDPGDLAHQFSTVTDSIHDFLWNKSREKIMVIEGDAAIGKTSLVSWMCYHAQAEDEEARALFQGSHVVCVRLRELEFKENEESADPILRYLNISDAREFAKRYPNAILILDGADELGMVSSLKAARIGQFILNSCNSLAIRKLIVTSRPQILDVSHLDTILFDTRRITLTPFPSYKRAEWIDKYLSLGETVSEETLNYIDSLTDQEADGVANTPLALYLLVRCKYKEEYRNNLWALYHEIFSKAIVETYYNASFVGSKRVLSEDEAKLNYAMVKEIAYTMFRNSGYNRFHINRQELDECARAVGLEGANADRVKQTCVLCAYWKNSTDGALEFYHNNIRDFFLCEYICDKILEVVKDMPENCADQDDQVFEPLIKLCCRIFPWCGIISSHWTQFYRLIALRLTSEAKASKHHDTLYGQLVRKQYVLQLPDQLLSTNTIWSMDYDRHSYLAAKNITAHVLALWHVFLQVTRPALKEENKKFYYSLGALTILRDWHRISAVHIDIPPIGVITLYSHSIYADISFGWLTLNYADFSECDLDTVSYSHSRLKKVNFSNCSIKSTDFSFSQLQRCSFKGTKLNYGSFKCAELKDSMISCAHVHHTRFSSVTLTDSQIINTNFDRCSFDCSQIEKTTFENTTFTNSTFDNAEFRNVKFNNCTFKNCHFDGATAQNCTYRNVDPETAAQLEAIGFTEDTTERIFYL